MVIDSAQQLCILHHFISELSNNFGVHFERLIHQAIDITLLFGWKVRVDIIHRKYTILSFIVEFFFEENK